MVYVTVPGVVTHKVPFVAAANFHGEFSFNMHGLHYIDASNEFREWNKEKKVCLFVSLGTFLDFFLFLPFFGNGRPCQSLYSALLTQQMIVLPDLLLQK